MSKVNQIVSFNLKSQLDSIRPRIASEYYKDAIRLFEELTFCYENTITPNGSINLKDLNKMLSFDSELAIQLNNLRKISTHNQTVADSDYLKSLKGLIKDREDFVRSIRA